MTSLRRCRKKRHSFAEEHRKTLKTRALEQAQSLEFWYRDKYKLTPNDPRFTDLSVADIELEFWTSIYFDKIKNGAKPDDIASTDLATLDFDPEKTAQSEIERI